MRDEIRKYNLDIALLGKGGRTFTDRDSVDLENYIKQSYSFLGGFIDDIHIGDVSGARLIWRAGRYSYLWDRYTRFSIPSELFDLLPAHPGTDCLGGEACGCWLGWEKVGDEWHVTWIINPAKEHCVLCLEFAAAWQPLIIKA